MKQHLGRILLGIAITLFFAGHALRWYDIGLVDRLENIIYDSRLRMTMPGGVDDRIVILDIDEKSLQEVARWPWPRDVMARLVDTLFERYRIALLGFDVVFAEPDHSSGVRTLDALARAELKDDAAFQSRYRALRPSLDNDGRFAAALRGRAVVLGFYFNTEAQARRLGALPPAALPKGALAAGRAEPERFSGFGGNLSRLQENARGAGHFDMSSALDDDGLVRRVPLIVEFDGAYYEALSLAMLRAFLAQRDGRLPGIEPMFPAAGAVGGGTLEGLKVGELRIPVDESASALVPFRGRQGSFRYLSLADVLAGRAPVDALAGRIALVGTTAPGLKDQRATPVGSVYPGVEVHANLLAGMLNGSIKHKPLFMTGAEVLLLVVVGGALSLLLPVLAPLWATVASIASLVLVTGLDVAVWQHAGWVLPLAGTLLMTALLYTANMAYGYVVEARIRRRVAERFGEYVPPEIVDRIVSDPGRYNSMEPRAAELTILFADVRGFTGISEALSPEELREYINQYLTDMSRIIKSRHRGTLDKYIGDAIMAFWGAPVDDPQHARNGVLAALEMQRECKVLNQKLAGRGWPALNVGIGLNTGNVRVGDMGSQVRRAYTAMGDAVNVASRLEARTKHYGVGVLAGEATRAAATGIMFREVDRIRVKGRESALTVYEPIGPDAEVDGARRAELELWDGALRDYRALSWSDAEAKLAQLGSAHPGCGLYRVFAARVAELRRDPPPAGWDGVTVFDAK